MFQGGAELPALLAAIKSSPIVVLSARLFRPRDWARVRRSSDVDAFVLAWIASHVHAYSRRPRQFM